MLNDSYSCAKCGKPCEDLEDSEPSILCDSCNKWIHYKCSKQTVNQFNKLGRNSDPFLCTDCIGENLPFTKLSTASFFNKTNNTDSTPSTSASHERLECVQNL